MSTGSVIPAPAASRGIGYFERFGVTERMIRVALGAALSHGGELAGSAPFARVPGEHGGPMRPSGLRREPGLQWQWLIQWWERSWADLAAH